MAERASVVNEVVVDPAIAAVIKSPSAPAGVPKPVRVREMPGPTSAWAGIKMILGSLRHGTAHAHVYRERFGDIYQVPFAGTPMVAVWDADEIQKILKNEDRVWSTAMGWDALMFESLDPRAGNVGNLLTLDFERHRVARKLVQPAFSMKAVEAYRGIAGRGFDRVIPGWIERGQVELKTAVRALLADVANAIFTGIEDPAQIARVDRALHEFWRGMMAISRRPWLSPTFRRSRRGLATLLSTFQALVPERRARGGEDLFSRMCQVTDEDLLGDEAMVRIFLTIMFGAFDTTSVALTSMGYLLARHPEWQDRVRTELQQIPPGELDLAGMKKLVQLEWVWKETLRLMPVASFVPRRALREVTVSGYVLAPGTFVAPMNGGIGRHPRWWKEPLRFDPDRFSPERAEDQEHSALAMPFGGGVHACVGMQLAYMEMKLFWHALMRDARFTLMPDYEARHTHSPMGCVSGNVALKIERV